MPRVSVLAMVVALLLATAVEAAAIEFEEQDLSSNSSMWSLYRRWSARYSIVRQPGEIAHRFQVFKQNARRILDFNNNASAGYTMGLNELGDMTPDETELADSCILPTDTSDLVGGGEAPQGLFKFRYDGNGYVPKEFDWRKPTSSFPQGLVTEVGNQGGCKSCWAWAATAAMETLNALRTSKLTALSVQQLVDCDTRSNGCAGGLPEKAFSYIEVEGQSSMEDYPYTGVQGQCKKNAPRVATMKGWMLLTPGDEGLLMNAVQEGPVAVLVAPSDEMKRYTGGIFHGPCGNALRHAMAVVGYGTENGEGYWILKNSWGQQRGEGGYIRMSRHACGVLDRPAFPYIKGTPPYTRGTRGEGN